MASFEPSGSKMATNLGIRSMTESVLNSASRSAVASRINLYGASASVSAE